MRNRKPKCNHKLGGKSILQKQQQVDYAKNKHASVRVAHDRNIQVNALVYRKTVEYGVNFLQQLQGVVVKIFVQEAAHTQTMQYYTKTSLTTKRKNSRSTNNVIVQDHLKAGMLHF
jgi:hypothetical protein